MNECIMYLCMYPVSQLLYGHDTSQLGLFKESNNSYKLTSRLTLNVVTRTKVHSGQRCFRQILAKTNRTHQQLMKDSPLVSTLVIKHLSPPPTEKLFFLICKAMKRWRIGHKHELWDWQVVTQCLCGNRPWKKRFAATGLVGRIILI